MKNLPARAYRALFSARPIDAVEALLSKAKHPKEAAEYIVEMLLVGHRKVLHDAFEAQQKILSLHFQNQSSGCTSWIERKNENEINQVIGVCLRHGVDVDYVGSEGLTLLSVALGFGKDAVAKFLIEQGASIDSVPHENGVSSAPLVIAASQALCQNNDRWVSALLDMGADIEGRDSSGQTALWHIALTGPLEWAVSLIKRGASPMALNEDGNTMLHDLVSEHHKIPMETAAWMCRQGVDPDHQNHRGQSVYDVVAYYFGQDKEKEVRTHLGKALAERRADLLDKASPSAPVLQAKSMRL